MIRFLNFERPRHSLRNQAHQDRPRRERSWYKLKLLHCELFCLWNRSESLGGEAKPWREAEEVEGEDQSATAIAAATERPREEEEAQTHLKRLYLSREVFYLIGHPRPPILEVFMWCLNFYLQFANCNCPFGRLEIVGKLKRERMSLIEFQWIKEPIILFLN